LSTTKHKKALVFFSAGVGDAVLLVPLVNRLKKQGYHVTGLFTSPFHCESIFENTVLFDAIEVKKSKPSLVLFSLLHFRSYDAVFLNHFAYSRSQLSVAALLGKAVYCNYKDYTSAQSSKAIHFIEPKANTHDALQNVFLSDNNATLSDLDFRLRYKPQNTNKFQLSKNYVVLQISSANNKAPYKNWPSEKWLSLLQHLTNRLPGIQCVVLGDDSELALTKTLGTLNNKNIVSLIGKTQLSDVMEIVFHSAFYIGLDSGIMHMAVALNKPTFTLWGASNPALYGYAWLGEKHKVVTLNLPCAPCSAWIGRNNSRVDDPLKCPDFKCIRDLPVETVKVELDNFVKIIEK
jgi:ADP-heptose:LPS heptosyltransferase